MSLILIHLLINVSQTECNWTEGPLPPDPYLHDYKELLTFILLPKLLNEKFSDESLNFSSCSLLLHV
jgi:hypothetical protein